MGDRDLSGKILLVEDEQAIREMIGFTLSQSGFSYVEAGDTNQAEAEIIQELPDLILPRLDAARSVRDRLRAAPEEG